MMVAAPRSMKKLGVPSLVVIVFIAYSTCALQHDSKLAEHGQCLVTEVYQF